MNPPSQFILVDDDPINNMLSKYIISNVAPDAGIQLFTDPVQALAAIEQRFDDPAARVETVLFLDINMPTMSGWEFLEQLAVFPGRLIAHISIFILSSSIDPKDVSNAESHPLVQGYFSKPLSKDIVRKVIAG
ncbi:response regulator [Dyadobacter sandarakinus]|uniref:Response regulator n=1 Tax=Dyadobacter sandarakinus TaxID=2747268 RepID=A0ABX7I863_9BACT|nr:response regulator [Dyadobacter sandarakinus]QRR01368.1 response regulator [Dyadobacter sandarakinus]